MKRTMTEIKKVKAGKVITVGHVAGYVGEPTPMAKVALQGSATFTPHLSLKAFHVIESLVKYSPQLHAAMVFRCKSLQMSGRQHTPEFRETWEALRELDNIVEFAKEIQQ